MRATRAVIHLENLRTNISLLKQHVGKEKRICMAVKADAYGHGALKIAETALGQGVDCLGVATVDEGKELRAGGIAAPILLFGLCLPEELAAMVSHDITPMAAGMDMIRRLEKVCRSSGKKTPVHLKIDTGMGRLGCQPQEALQQARLIQDSPFLHLQGVCTHLSSADMARSEFTIRQLELFQNSVDNLRQNGIDSGLIHCANSGAALDYPEASFDMVRLGIMLYGYYPSHDQERRIPIKPLMELQSRIVFLKRVKAGTSISYGGTYVTARETVIATIPAGYGDGYSRLLSNRGKVLIGGKLFPIAGRVCMDQFMVDLGSNPQVRLYDRVTLFGPDPLGPSAEDVADLTGTIAYEVTCNVNKRVPRIYSDSDPRA